MIAEKPETSGLDCPFIPGLIGVIGTGRVSAPLIQYCDTAYVIWCFVDDVFYVGADVGAYVVVYVGADVGAYVVVYVSVDVGACAVVYVVLLIFSMGGQAFKASGASEHVGFLPR